MFTRKPQWIQAYDALVIQAHLGPIMAVVVAVTAPLLSDPKAKLKGGPTLPTPLYLIFTTAALASAHLVLFDVLMLVLGYPPGAGLLAGATLMALALAQIPLLQQRYPHSQSARRAMAAVATFGVLLAVLRPPLPEKVHISCCTCINWRRSRTTCNILSAVQPY